MTPKAIINGKDITEHLRVLYDVACAEVTTSPHLCVEEIESIMLIGAMMGFDRLDPNSVSNIGPRPKAKPGEFAADWARRWTEQQQEWAAQVQAVVNARIADLQDIES